MKVSFQVLVLLSMVSSILDCSFVCIWSIFKWLFLDAEARNQAPGTNTKSSAPGLLFRALSVNSASLLVF